MIKIYTQEEIKEILIKEYPNTTKRQKEELAERLGYKNSDVLRQIASKMGVSKKYITHDLDGEEWGQHDNFPDYLISTHGRVKGLLRNNLISMRVHEGYYDCRIKNKRGFKESPRIHRLVAEVFVKNLEPNVYTVVNHKDANKLNNHHTNLEWCTTKYNNQHAVENIDFDYSNCRPSEYLKKEEVLDICKMISEGKSIADIMGVSVRYTRARVEKIRQRKTFIYISKDFQWE